MIPGSITGLSSVPVFPVMPDRVAPVGRSPRRVGAGLAAQRPGQHPPFLESALRARREKRVQQKALHSVYDFLTEVELRRNVGMAGGMRFPLCVSLREAFDSNI